jgi:signal transduction histidine kinase
MTDHVIVAIQNGYAYIRKHPQLLLTIILIAVIPLAFMLSGQQFLNAARLNQETLERERLGTLHDLFAAYIEAVGFDPERMTQEIRVLTAQNTDITRIAVAYKEGEEIHIIVSTDADEVGTDADDTSLYQTAAISPGTSIIAPSVHDGVRYWHSIRRIEADTGIYYVVTDTSLAQIDTLFAQRIRVAYYWLFGILAVILLLILRHVRLIDYAYLYRETKRANEMKDLFTNMIAHELRAPLTAMRGYASLIRERKDVHENVRVSAERIEQSSDRLILIVNDLLDVARIHSGKLSIRSERTNIRAVITQVVDAMRMVASEKHIALNASVPGDVYIQGDEKRLYQAFTNLVSNAIKYTKAGSIEITLEELSNRVEVRVKDTGAGISAANQKQLFAPFFRVENSDTAGTVGTGLGMWITKQLIELMHGSIGVESIKGVGTHVVVTLPKE